MELQELNKLVEQEIQWLRYYTLREYRHELNINSNIYNDLKPMNYAKKIIKLDLRCCPCVLTSDDIISNKTNILDIKKSNTNLRGFNKLSPLETYITLYPDKKIEIIDRLKYEHTDTNNNQVFPLL